MYQGELCWFHVTLSFCIYTCTCSISACSVHVRTCVCPLQNQRLEAQLREREQERDRLREMLEKDTGDKTGAAYLPPGLPSKVSTVLRVHVHAYTYTCTVHQVEMISDLYARIRPSQLSCLGSLVGKSVTWKANGRGFESHPRQPIFFSCVVFCCIVVAQHLLE